MSSLHVVRARCQEVVQQLTSHGRADVFLPAPVRGVVRLVIRGDQKILALLEGSMNNFISVLTVLLVLVGAVLVGFFFTVQVRP